MTIDEVLTEMIALLQRDGRLSYRLLKRRFLLDDEYLEDIKAELIDARRLATDEDGKVLVWVGSSAKEETENRRIGESAREDISSSDSKLRTLNSEPSAAERRQLTVMFCDLVGSTALSTQLDPEELRAVIQAYRETCATAIAHFGGYLAKYIGDGLLVYLGYPHAHDDDAARAVRTGLEIVAAIQQLSFPTIHLPHPLQVRIGIHTGLVVAGEMGVGDLPEPLAIVGETPNLAARIQGQANPDEVMISAATYRLVEGLFECEDGGQPELKGISTPLTLYRVVKEGEAQSRFEVALQTGLTPLVGRAHEIEFLRDRWARATQGAGQVVLLSGEPGIGKSRLVQEFKEQLGHAGMTRIEFRCSSYHQNSALYPIIDHLQRLLQFARDDTPAVKLEKLQHTLSHYRFPQADTVPLLAALLSLPHPDGSPPITGSPQKQKEKMQAALVAWLIEEAERNTVYTIWEDLHWADPSTLEVLNLIVDQAPTARLYVLLTFRPEFTPPWGNRSHVSQLTLSRLGRSEVEMMVERMMDGKVLPPEVVEQIVAKTDGVPLFVEELTKTVLESVESMGSTESLGSAIPTTLHDSLMARLDRLGTAKEIAQMGATIGRDFDYALLQAVSSLNEETLQQGLKQLVTAELVYQHGLLPQAHYLFKHALIQNTAYQSLLKSRRQQLHQQIAQVLQEQFPAITEAQPELLAHHYTEAGLIEQAIPYWQQAGQRAVQRSANAEAISHFTKGLGLLETLPDTPERTQQELTLQLALGVPLMATKGYAASEVGQVYARARVLSKQMGETPQLFSVLCGLYGFYQVRGEFPTARELGEELLTLAQTVQDSALLLVAHWALGETLLRMADFVACQEHLEQGIALYNHQQHHTLAFLYGLDPGVGCRNVASASLWYLGYPDQALKRTQEAFTLAHELSHPFSLGHTLLFAAMLHLNRREGQLAQERAEAVIVLAREQEFLWWLAGGTFFRGSALAEQGQEEEGIAQIRQGLNAGQATGAQIALPGMLARLAEAHGKVGRVAEGVHLLDEATTVMRKTEECQWEAELYRLRGELMLAQSSVQSLASRVKEAEKCFLKAIEVARKQQAKSLELRAAMSLACLWQQQGKKTEAHKLLSDVYNWFTEGFDTKDLQEAKALLEKLA